MLQEPARLLQHVFYFIAHETTLQGGTVRRKQVPMSSGDCTEYTIDCNRIAMLKFRTPRLHTAGLGARGTPRPCSDTSLRVCVLCECRRRLQVGIYVHNILFAG